MRRLDQDKVENHEVFMGMEYASAIGTMVIDELVEVNERVASRVDLLSTKMTDLERDGKDLDGCLEAEKERVWELEEQVVHLELE